MRSCGLGEKQYGLVFLLCVLAGLSAVALAAEQPGAIAVGPRPQTQPAQIVVAPPGPDAPKFRCDEPIKDFGERWAGDKVDHSYVICNDGKTPLQLKVIPTCGCTVAGQFENPVPPGKCTNVPIVLSTGMMTTPLTKIINVETSDPANQKVTLTIKGTVKARIQMEPYGGLNWGRVTPLGPTTRTMKITNNLPTPLKLEEVPNEQNKIFQAKVEEKEPGKVYEITVDAKPPYSEGQNNAILKFKTGITEQPELNITCNLYSPSLVEVVPTSVFATTSPTQPYKQLITVRYNGDGNMKIESATASDPKIELEVKEQQPGKIYQIPATFPAGFETPATSPTQIVVRTDVKGKETITIPVRVRLVTPTPQPETLVGRPAPPLQLKALDGTDVKLGGSTQDKVAVVNFWATWCPHCKKQIPMLEQIAKTYASKGVQFLNVATGARPGATAETEKAAADQLAKSLGISMPIALDALNSAQTVAKNYLVAGYPVVFLVGKSGVVEAVHRGDGGTPEGAAALEKQIRAELDVLLEGKTRSAFPTPTIAGATPPATQPATPKREGPALVFDIPRQDIGQQKPATSTEVNLRFRNPGTAPIVIQEVKAGENLEVVPGYPTSLPAGGIGEIRVKTAVPEKPGTFTRTLTVRSNDKEKPTQEVTVVGTSKAYIEVMPANGVMFSRNTRTHGIPSLATILYNGPGKVEFGKPVSSSPKFEATVEPIAGGPYSKLIVKALPPFEVGEHKATLTIPTDCKQQPSIEVPVTLTMPQRIEVVPPAVVLPPATHLQQARVTIRNNGDKSLNILGFSSSSDKLRTQFFPEQDGMSYRLQLTVPPQAEFTKAGGETITIRTDDPEFKEIVIPVRFATSEDANKVSQAPR